MTLDDKPRHDNECRLLQRKDVISLFFLIYTVFIVFISYHFYTEHQDEVYVTGVLGFVLNLIVLVILLLLIHNQKTLKTRYAELDMLNTLIDESNDMVFILRMEDGYIQYVNQTSIRMLGYSLEELRTIGIEGFRRPLKEGEPFMEHLEELKAIGRLTDYAILTRKDGSEFPIEANVRILTYGDKSYNIAFVRDITENNKYLQKLNAITQHLNEAQKITKLGSWYLNLRTGELDWSDEIYALFELDPALHSPT
ncbi:MAG: hypothetical protein QG558_1598 [Campylobacterota bacterium]|nr:hypothetical protein [Campylobacterota bacterium]